MARHRPVYTYELRKPRSLNDASESQLLTPPAGAPHADSCKFSSAPVAGYLPYGSEPSGMRGELEPLEAHVDKGQLRIRLLDRRLGVDNLKRWFTAFLHDAVGQEQALGGKLVMRESLDGGTSFADYWVGRLEDYEADDGKNEITLTVRDLSEDLDQDIFVDRPHSSVAYAALQRLSPLGLHVPYSDFPLTPKYTSAVRQASGLLRFGNPLVFPAAGVPAENTICTKALADHIETAEGAGDGGGTGEVLVDLLGGWSFHSAETVRIVAKRLDTSATGEFKCRALWIKKFASGVEAKRVADVIPEPLEATHPKFMAVPPAGTSVEWELYSTQGPTKGAPIVIGPVHPVQLLADICDGKFGYLSDAGAVTRAVTRNGSSFSSLIADGSFPLVKFVIDEKKKLNDWVEEELCKPFGLAYGWNASGQLVVYDMRQGLSGVFADGFDYPDALDLPAPWEKRTSGSSTIGVLNGQGYAPTAASMIYTRQCNAADGRVQMTVPVLPGNVGEFVSLNVRLTAGGNYFRLIIDGDTWWADRVVAGVPTTLASGSHTSTNGLVMAVEMSGTTLRFYLGSTLKHTATGETHNQTATDHGFGISTTTTARVDDWIGPGVLAPPTITDTDLVSLEEGVGWRRSRRSAITRVDASFFVDEYFSILHPVRVLWHNTHTLADTSSAFPDFPCHLFVSTEVPVKLADLGGRALDFGEKKVTIKGTGYRAATREAAKGLPAVEQTLEQLQKRLHDLKVPFVSGAMEYTLTARRGSNADCQVGELRYLRTSFIVDPTTAQRMSSSGVARLVRCVARSEDGPELSMGFMDLAQAETAAVPTLAIATVGGKIQALDFTVTRNANSDPVLVEIAMTETSVTEAPAETSSLWAPVAVREADGTFRTLRLASGKKIWARARSQSGSGERRYLPSAWVASTPTSVTLTALTAPSALTATGTTTTSTFLQWTNGETDCEIEIFVTTGSAPSTWTKDLRIEVLPAGTKRFTLRGLDGPSTAHTIGIRHKDQAGGVSAMTTVSVTTDGSTPKKAPNPRGRGFTIHRSFTA